MGTFARVDLIVSAPVLVLAAQEAEIGALLGRGERWSRGKLHGRPWWRGRVGGHAVVVAVTGEGRRLARSGAENAVSSFDPCLLLGAGVAGALSPGLERGHVVVSSEVTLESGRRLAASEGALSSATQIGITPAVVLTSDRIVGDPVEKSRLWLGLRSPAAAVVDMESFDFAASAAEHSVPFLILRAVSDEASESVPSWLNDCRLANGAIGRARVAVRMPLHPRDARWLLRLRRRLSICAESLAESVVDVLAAPIVAPRSS